MRTGGNGTSATKLRSAADGSGRKFACVTNGSAAPGAGNSNGSKASIVTNALSAASEAAEGLSFGRLNEKIRTLERNHHHMNGLKNRIRSSCGSLVMGDLATHGVVPESISLEALTARAAKETRALLAGERHHISDDIVKDVEFDQYIIKKYASFEKGYETELKSLVGQHPVWTGHFKTVKGIGEMGVAKMIALGGDPALREKGPSCAGYKKYLGFCPMEMYERSKRTGNHMRPKTKRIRILWEIVELASRQGPYKEICREMREKVALAHPEMIRSIGEDGTIKLTKHGWHLTMFKTGSVFVRDFWEAWMRTRP